MLYAEPNYVRHLDVLPNDPMFSQLYGAQPGVGQGHRRAVGLEHDDRQLERDRRSPRQRRGLQPPRSQRQHLGERRPGGQRRRRRQRLRRRHCTAGTSSRTTTTPFDYNGHGTHVAGTIGAEGNNALGVTGVNWDVSIMPVRAADASGGLPDSAIIDGINYACANGADVVNGSFGSSDFSMAISDAVKSAPCANTLFVFAAGNEGKNLEPTGPPTTPTRASCTGRPPRAARARRTSSASPPPARTT